MGLSDSLEKVQDNATTNILRSDGSDYDQSTLGDIFPLKNYVRDECIHIYCTRPQDPFRVGSMLDSLRAVLAYLIKH